MSSSTANNPSAYQHPLAVVQLWHIPATSEPLRADRALIQRVGRLSRQKAQRIIQQGDLRINQQAIKPSKRLWGGERAELWRIPPDRKEDALDLQVQVLHEDDSIVVINKPPDLAVHPTARYLYRTLTHWLKEHYPKNTPHPCHRLDRETSGIVVCARSKAAQSALKTAFANGAVEKTYMAVVRGHLTQALHLTYPLALQGDNGLVRIRMVSAAQGLPSSTDVVPVRYCQATHRTLVECCPHTGRQHQIRAHLSIAGYPIVGDKLYAMGDSFFDDFTQNKASLDILEHPRQALHAHRIRFTLQGIHHIYTSPFPTDLQALLT